MKNKRVAALFLSLAIACSALTPAFAAGRSTVADQAYDRIETVCSRSVTVSADKDEKNLVKAERTVAQANEKIENLIVHAQHTKKNDVAKLLAQVDKVVAQTAEQVARLGYEVACEYTAHEVDGQTVLIDPLRVVNRR